MNHKIELINYWMKNKIQCIQGAIRNAGKALNLRATTLNKQYSGLMRNCFEMRNDFLSPTVRLYLNEWEIS